MKKTLGATALFLLILTVRFAFGEDTEKKIKKQDKLKNDYIEQISENIGIIDEANSNDEKKIQELQQIIEERTLYASVYGVCNAVNKQTRGTLIEKQECDSFPIQKYLTPDELFYGVKKSDNPHISQHEEDHFRKGNGGVLATDIATGFKAEIYAPDYLDEVRMYEVEVLEDDLLGNYLKLKWKEKGDNMYWILAHTRTRLKTGDIVYTGQRIGEMDLSGATTGYHLHQELWRDGLNISYSTRSQVVSNRRAGKFETPDENIVYFTTYDLGDVNQNDSTPCIGASGKDLCKLAETGLQSIALTSDMRNKLGVKFGDRVKLSNGDSIYTAQVEDEMNARFRYSCIKRGGYCVKGDIARYKGKAQLPSGVYFISK